uniref:Uncharacterized protein n=1 Tax=viral metagenome TaxID=1070528 RepID=A0A6C0DIP3_9ZZZZ
MRRSNSKSNSNSKTNKKTNLTSKDYIHILEYYDINIPKSKRLLEKEAEKLLSDKLCRCIKSVNGKGNIANEQRSIGICTKSIFNNKGLTRGKFKCKKPTRFVNFNKTMKNRK